MLDDHSGLARVTTCHEPQLGARLRHSILMQAPQLRNGAVKEKPTLPAAQARGGRRLARSRERHPTAAMKYLPMQKTKPMNFRK